MTPLMHPRTDAEKAFNVVHKKGRIVVERSFRLLKARFRYVIILSDFFDLTLTYRHE